MRFAAALAALDGLGLDELDVHGDLQVALELGGQTLLERFELADLVERELGHGLDTQLDVVERASRGEDDLVLRGDLWEAGEHLLDLGREHVHAAQDEHVVGTADDAVDLAMRTAAGAGLGDDAGDVAGAVAHERAALARERGEHQFAVFAIRHRLQGVGVDDLGEEVVLGQVQAAHLLALEGHARP